VNDYFNYFTEIEERFCQRRGTVVLCSTLDWALMETWKDAGIPLEAVLRGIDAAFDRYDARPNRSRKVNSLAYCAQEVLAASEEMQEAAVGAKRTEQRESGLEPDSIAAFLERNAAELHALLARRAGEKQLILPETALPVVRDAARTLQELAVGVKAARTTPLEDLERRLTVVEEKVLAALLAAVSDDELLAVRAEADRELAPYKRKMTAAQIDHLHKQYLHKRLLEGYHLPRLSLFYM
jgi:hypothetical protein